jgi:hypothetical protein
MVESAPTADTGTSLPLPPVLKPEKLQTDRQPAF